MAEVRRGCSLKTSEITDDISEHLQVFTMCQMLFQVPQGAYEVYIIIIKIYKYLNKYFLYFINKIFLFYLKFIFYFYK